MMRYSGKLSPGKFIQSKKFITLVQKEVDKYKSFYEHRGIPKPEITTNVLLSESVLIDVFIEILICKAKKKFYTLFKTDADFEEARVRFAEALRLCITKYRPNKGVFGTFFGKAGYFRAIYELEKSHNLPTLSLEELQGNSHEGSWEDFVPIPEAEQPRVDFDQIIGALARVLQKQKDWQIFYQIVYTSKTLKQIGRSCDLTSGAVSIRFQKIRLSLADALKNARTMGNNLSNSRDAFCRFVEIFRENITEEEFRKKIPRIF